MASTARERELSVRMVALEEALAKVCAALPQTNWDALGVVGLSGLSGPLVGLRTLTLPTVDLASLHTSLAHFALPPSAALDPELLRSALWAALDLPGEDAPAAATSVRLPAAVHDVARNAVDAGWASSLTELIVTGLRHRLGVLAASALDEKALSEVRSALEAHYAEHPDTRPPLAMIVQSAAELEGHPAADRPDLILRAVDDLGEDSYVEDVLAWVKGALAHEGSSMPKHGAAAKAS